jgi:uncharacterized short protein YbdD (DUF466 family)
MSFTVTSTDKGEGYMKRMSLVPLMMLAAVVALFPASNPVFGSESSPVAQYKVYLDTLDKGNMESLPEALNGLIGSFKGASEEAAADAYRLFRMFYSGAVYTLNCTALPGEAIQTFGRAVERIEIDGEDCVSCQVRMYGILSVYERAAVGAKKSLKGKYGTEIDTLEEYHRCGLTVSMSEGIPFFIESRAFKERAADILTGDYGDYVRYMAEEDPDQIYGEMGTLQIEWENLRGRIVRMEKFVCSHPDLPETKSDLQPNLKKYISAYLCGIGYSFVCNPETGEIYPELRESYEHFIDENSDSSYHSLVSRVYDAWKENNFCESDKLAELLASEGYDFEVWRLEEVKKSIIKRETDFKYL